MSSISFIYNADSGLANALLDVGNRILNPKDYPCALCMVTYGPFGMKQDWKKFTRNLPFDVLFMHKDELPAKYQTLNLDFPCVVVDDGETTKVLINAAEFQSIKDLQTLKQQVTSKLQSNGYLPAYD